MNRRVAAIAAVALLAGAGLAFAQSPITVSTADQLVKAIGSNKTIVLKPGTYTIGKTNTVKNQSIRYEKVDNGYQLTIVGVKNLTIQGGEGVSIVSVSSFVYPLAFEDCQDITVEGLTAGHESTEGCMAGVVSVVSSSAVTLSSCDFYGSGSIGLYVESSSEVNVVETAIHDCTNGAVSISGSGSVTFDTCNFYSNQAYPLIYVNESDYIHFSGCEMSGNEGESFIDIYAEEGFEDISLYSCYAYQNTIDSFSSTEWYPAFEETYFEENNFEDPTADNGDYSGEEEETGYYIHYPSGLQFAFPPYWSYNEDVTGNNGAIYLPGTDTALLVFPAYKQPQGASDLKAMKKNQVAMLKAYVDAMKKNGNMVVSVKQAGDFFDIEGMPAVEYRGTAQYDKKKLFVWARFVQAGDGTVYALSAATDDETEFGEGADLNAVMNGVTLAPMGK
ncbi:MAG: right-handed parallel beta-helix repeat-containing protein [Spirochaetes bacterium]|nr:right-handed parallel beta-helix repeat-containing protein [Spirochaetota bacterium]